MTNKVAVAVIHGAGSQGPDFADEMIDLLTERLQSYLPENNQTLHDKIVFKTVYWADILARKQRRLWGSVTDDDQNLSYQDIRKFIINFGADAVAYQPGATRREIYNRVHNTVANCLKTLAAEAGPQAPLCIIGHSIGTVITHNYLFDLGEEIIANQKISQSITPLEAGKTLTLLYFMGSPLALWSLRYENYRAITFPGQQVSNLFPQLQPKWVSYYDKDDILAYPIRSLSASHNELAEQGLLIDVPVNAGGFWTGWNPLSHLEYWTEETIINQVAAGLFEVWQKINPSA